jgi:hypothetical protein
VEPWKAEALPEPMQKPLPEPGVPGEAGFVDAICAALAVGLPLVITALRVSAAPQWRDDVAIVQSLGFVPIGGEGAPSALLAQIAALLPFGGRVLRAGLVGALGAALSGRAIYALARHALSRTDGVPRLTPLLALAAALTAVLCPTFQHEGTAAGGATLAVAFALLTLRSRQDARDGDVRAALATGAYLGLTCAESRVAALATVVALGVSALASGPLPRRRTLVGGTAFAVATWTFCVLPLAIRPLCDHGWVTLGLDFSRTEVASQLVAPTAGPFTIWTSEMGPLALVLGIGALVFGLVHRPLRSEVTALAVLVLADAVVPGRGGSVLVADPRASLVLLAVSALAIAAVIGVQTACLALRRARIPFAVPASVLLVVFHFTLVFAAVENSSDVVTEATALGADVWTDEALGELPSNALLLVRSPEVAWRLWAAELARGERPDLVVVPLSLVAKGTVARRLLAEEPMLAPLIRDVASNGRTSEYALADLADTRPLFVELDPAWDKHLLAHLRPTPLWLGFTAHPLGRSDRKTAILDDSARRAFQRVLGVAKNVPGGDPATLAVLGARAREHAVVLAALGDRDSTRIVLHDVRRIDPDSPFAPAVEQRLPGKGPLDLRALLE